MAFTTALSGMKAANADLNVTSNNIANVATTGFKQSRAEFADMFASSYYGVASTQNGIGSTVQAVAQQMNQGNITITNIFFDRGQGLRTPPLRCGLLPGVLRAELACPEEVLTLSDLPRTRLWVGNALRGLIPARLIL